jgi:hypothetical protein
MIQEFDILREYPMRNNQSSQETKISRNSYPEVRIRSFRVGAPKTALVRKVFFLF